MLSTGLARECPESIFSLGVSVWAFPVSLGLGSPIPCRAWLEQQAEAGGIHPVIFLPHGGAGTSHLVSCPRTGTHTTGSLGSQAFRLGRSYHLGLEPVPTIDTFFSLSLSPPACPWFCSHVITGFFSFSFTDSFSFSSFSV